MIDKKIVVVKTFCQPKHGEMIDKKTMVVKTFHLPKHGEVQSLLLHKHKCKMISNVVGLQKVKVIAYV